MRLPAAVRRQPESSLYGPDRLYVATLNWLEYMGDSRPFRTDYNRHNFFFSLCKCVMDNHKTDTTNFIFFENLSVSDGWNRRGIRAIIDPFEIYTINSLLKKNFETNFFIF